MTKEKKSLYIELKRDIKKVLDEYCGKAGIQKDDVGFAMGWLTGKLEDRQSLDQLMFLLQVYFFAGVYYAKTTKKFTYSYLNKEDRGKFLAELNKKLDGMMKQKEEKPTYMG